MASTATSTKVARALEELGLDVNTENIVQLQVLTEAMFIYQEREAARGGLWKEAGAVDSAHHLKSKAMRVDYTSRHTNLLRGEDRAIDEALDAVNYAAFYVRNVRSDRFGD